MALFQNLETNEVFRIYNTHLDHIGSEARTLGLSQILNKISQENTFIQAPVIITGDFNAFPNSVEMEPLESYPWLIDLTANIEGTFHDFGRMKELEKIDYIIAQDNILCNQVSIWDEYESGVYLSDHSPVCVEILVNSSVR
jgi:endonuclease/exonuclease/phosphatase family metal-dependent hydrolase